MSSNTWGLFQKGSSTKIPLKSIDVSVQILNNVAKVLYTQTYLNNYNSLLETEFFFPISSDACFDSFEAKFNDTVIKGVVQEKKQAKKAYYQDISQGKTSAYSEINKETGDIMKVMIGNIPPQCTIQIIYSYIQKLDTALNKFWCFRLFSSITPRYNSNLRDLMNQDISLLTQYPTISSKDNNAYPWNITVEIQSSDPITFVRSPTYEIVSSLGNENHTCKVTLNPSFKHFPNKDFVLLYSNGKQDKMDYILTPYEDGYCAMVNMIADFEATSAENAYENFAKAKAVENTHSLETVQGEYIFLLDRSGSMSGQRIEMAKKSLLLFIKSLPKNSYFNIVSFGYSHSSLFTSSVKYSEESINQALAHVQSLRANLGGTEIYDPLNSIFGKSLLKGYPRFVFLLTDGDVSNTQQVLSLIQANSDSARVFTVGVGSGCSQLLITKAAYYGKGSHEFVVDQSEIYEKVLSLLNASLSPCFYDLSLRADNFDAVVKGVSPNPASIPFLLNGQSITFFLFLRSQAFNASKKMSLKLELYDSRAGKQRSMEIVLDESEAFKNEGIVKLAIHDMIKELEAQKRQLPEERILWYDDLLFDMKQVKQSLLDLSIKHGVLSQETAFYCQIFENKKLLDQFGLEKVVVPALSTQSNVQYNQSMSNPTNLLGFDDFEAFQPSTNQQSSSKSSNFDLYEGFSYDPDVSVDQIANNNPQLYGLQSGTKSWGQSNPPVNNTVDLFGDFFSVSSPNANKSTTTTSSFGSQPQNYNNSYTSPPNYSSSNYKSPNLLDDSELFFGSVGKEASKKETIPLPLPKTTMNNNYNLLDFDAFATTPSSQISNSKPTSSSGSNKNYFDVILKQNIEGYWDAHDSQLNKSIFNSEKLPVIPQELPKANSSVGMERVWLTILILVWFELACPNDRKVWLLIHQKGTEWLKKMGVEYEKYKNFGKQALKI